MALDWAKTYSPRETGRFRSWQLGTQSRVDLQGHGNPGGRVRVTQIANQKFLGYLCVMVRACYRVSCYDLHPRTGPSGSVTLNLIPR